MDFSGPCDVMLQMRVFYFSAFWELFPALFIMKSVGSSLKSGGSNCLLMLMANQLRKCIYINSTIIINKATPYAVSQSHAKVLSQKNGKRNSLSQFRAIKRRNGKICETHVLLLRLIFFICVYIFQFVRYMLCLASNSPRVAFCPILFTIQWIIFGYIPQKFILNRASTEGSEDHNQPGMHQERTTYYQYGWMYSIEIALAQLYAWWLEPFMEILIDFPCEVSGI